MTKPQGTIHPLAAFSFRAHKGRTMQVSGSTGIAYLRVSTDEQRNGPEAQRQAIEQWARREGIEVRAWYTDRGVSGASPIEQRPALLQALSDVRVLRASVLLVAKRDRLARDVLVAATIERALPRSARLVSCDGTGNGDSPADALMRTVIDGMSAYERALIRERTKRALHAKRGRGERVGSIPYGSRLTSDGTRLEPCEDEQRTIARIKALLAEGVSQRGIVRVLASEGLVSRNGRPFLLTQVRRVLGLDRVPEDPYAGVKRIALVS